MIKVSSKNSLPKDIKEKEFILIDTNGNEKETRRIIDSLKGKKCSLAVYGYDDAFNRRVIETMKISYLFCPERLVENKKDTLKQRDSGINHVVAKEAAKKGVSIVVDFDYLKGLSKNDKVVVLSRIMQNVKICRKAKCQIKIFSTKADEKGLGGFCFSIRMSSQQVKEAILKI
jgi:RNase P/RNase MRP subunit p30